QHLHVETEDGLPGSSVSPLAIDDQEAGRLLLPPPVRRKIRELRQRGESGPEAEEWLDLRFVSGYELTDGNPRDATDLDTLRVDEDELIGLQAAIDPGRRGQAREAFEAGSEGERALGSQSRERLLRLRILPSVAPRREQ